MAVFLKSSLNREARLPAPGMPQHPPIDQQPDSIRRIPLSVCVRLIRHSVSCISIFASQIIFVIMVNNRRILFGHQDMHSSSSNCFLSSQMFVHFSRSLHLPRYGCFSLVFFVGAPHWFSLWVLFVVSFHWCSLWVPFTGALYLCFSQC